MRAALPALPALDALPSLRAALSVQGRAVLTAPPGSGKTTLLPLALLDEPWLAGRRILMLEPRRVAARAAAARMAGLLGECVGQTVGYRVRFDSRVSALTRIEVITEGLLTRRLQQDAELPGVGLVIFDEFHERSLDVDLALALALDARAAINPALRVLVMSATLDTSRVAALLDDAPVVEAGGRLHPVEIEYCPPRRGQPLHEAVAAASLALLERDGGDVLAFLPGAREIRRAAQWLAERQARAELHPLYGELSSAEQDAALRLSAAGRRKIILATNIAQTSLTVEGVSAVVDGGYARVARFDLGAGADRLDTVRISRAAAEQRAGRAGRLAAGRAIRLWSADQHAALPAQDEPQIRQAELSRFALELAAWGATEPAQLPLLDAPPAAAWNYAVELLRKLGAIGEDRRITAHGRRLLAFPASPRIAHLFESADDKNAAAWLAALLESRGGRSVDVGERLRELRAAPPAARLRETVRHLLRRGGASDEGGDAADPAACGRLVASAFPERIARRREGRLGVFLCADGGEARLPAEDPLAGAAWLAIAHWDSAPPRRIRLAARIDEEAALAAGAAIEESLVQWDAAAEAVRAERRRRLGAIVLWSRPWREADPEALVAAMLEGVRRLGLHCLPWDEAARQWQARVASLARWRPREAWPAVDDGALLATIEHWLAPYLAGITRREQLARLDLRQALQAMLDSPRQQALDRLAPTHLSLPGGSRVALRYQPDGGAPVLAVKLQEMFGCETTPRVNDGVTPVLIHLLSPARRPVAVTQDLATFWRGAYQEVRRDLRGRYPRHPWPEDPLLAEPSARAKSRGR